MSEIIKRGPEVLKLVGEVDKWFLDHEENIAVLMESYRDRWAKRSDEETSALDLAHRTLSEMPLCWSLLWICKQLPLEGLEFISPKGGGWVRAGEKLTGDGFRWFTPHGFLFEERLGLVVCLTFGQFVSTESACSPGSRIAYVNNLAPGLVVCGSYGLAMLRGTQAEISDQLGLEYLIREKKVGYIQGSTP